jgi:hypothetical protein
MTPTEKALWRMKIQATDDGDANKAKVLENAALIVGKLGMQAVALQAASDLLARIESGRCEDPQYEAASWRMIYGQRGG